MSATDIINSIDSVIGLLVSIVAIYISIRLERRHIRMDLFHKRYNFYVACDIICGCCLTELENSAEKRMEVFNVKMDDYMFGSSEFLFDSETSKLILTIYSNWRYYIDVNYTIKSIENKEIADEHGLYESMQEEKERCKNFFEDARKELDIHFKKYLSLN